MRAKLRREPIGPSHGWLLSARPATPELSQPPQSAWLREKAARAAKRDAPVPTRRIELSPGAEYNFGHLARVSAADWQAAQAICADVLAHSSDHD